MSAPLKLNLGSGSKPLPNYTNVDRCYDQDIHSNSPGYTRLCVKGEVYPLRYAYAEEIRASHVLEHFPHGQTLDILKDWTRVLAPGGWLKVAVPDFAYIATKYLDEAGGLPLEGYTMGGQVDENDFHKAIFDERTLRRMFHECGLVEVQRWESEIDDCASLPVSLNLMGRKLRDGEAMPTEGEETGEKQAATIEVEGWEATPYFHDDLTYLQYRGFEYFPLIRTNEPEEYVPIIIAANGSRIRSIKSLASIDEACTYARECIDSILDTAALINHPAPQFAGIDIPKGHIQPVMTAPRLGFTAFMHSAFGAFAKLNMGNMLIQGGAYWHQGIEDVAEDAIAAGAKYILTFDYDSVFDHRDIEAMYGIMEACPGIGALVPLQMRREMQTALVTIRDAETGQNVSRIDSSNFETDVQRIATGHLGMTLIRAECLKSTPKPWFHAVPSPAGDWRDGHVDADIAFWRKFEDAGNSIYLANRVVLGHCELVVTWPDRNLEPMVQQISDFYKGGRPRKGSGIWQ